MHEATSDPPSKSLNILIADDDDNDRKHIKRALKQGGLLCICSEASSVEDAMEACQDRAFDCALIDYRLPGQDGLAGITALHNRLPQMAIIMVTGQGDEMIATEAMKRGALDYMPKILITGASIRRSIESAVEKANLLLTIAKQRTELEIFSRVSHEIRTPLNAILGHAQLMLCDPKSGLDAAANLKIIIRSGEHLLDMVNDVLDMSKIEAGRMELNPVIFDPLELLDGLTDTFRPLAEAKGLRFELSVQSESAPSVVADEAKIRRVLSNLIGNAIRFTRHGAINLHVTLNEKNGNRLWLSVSVEDTSSGIPAEEQKTLFEPFGCADGASLNTQEGIGLEMAISRKYARMMGGDITLTSTPDKGSVFCFEIPIRREDSPVAARRHNAPRHSIVLRARKPTPEILVFPDQVEIRDAGSGDLSESGHRPIAPAVLSAETFMNLPVELLRGLIDATTKGDKKRLDGLILKVREIVDTASGNALQDLADNYEYDALTQLVESCRR